MNYLVKFTLNTGIILIGWSLKSSQIMYKAASSNLLWLCVFGSSDGVSWEAAESGRKGGAERSQGQSSSGEFQLEHHHPEGQRHTHTVTKTQTPLGVDH